MRSKDRIIVLLSAAVVLLLGCAQTATSGPRPAAWAFRMKDCPDVPNLHKMDANLYRSGQPTEAGMAQLGQMGIRTIINLRTLHSDTDEIGSTGLLNERLHVNAWHIEKSVPGLLLRVNPRA